MFLSALETDTPGQRGQDRRILSRIFETAATARLQSGQRFAGDTHYLKYEVYFYLDINHYYEILAVDSHIYFSF